MFLKVWANFQMLHFFEFYFHGDKTSSINLGLPFPDYRVDT